MNEERKQGRWSYTVPGLTVPDGSYYDVPTGLQHHETESPNPEEQADSPSPPPLLPAPVQRPDTDILDPAIIIARGICLSQALPSSTTVFQLSDIARKYPNSLPMRVQVHNGYYSGTSQLSVSQDEVFDIHFIKHAKVVTLKDMSGEEELSLPLNSTVEFAVFYNPRGNVGEARMGYFFKSVAEVLACKPLPLVIKATRAYRGSFPENSVEAGELLLLTGVKTSSFPGRGKQLKACSLTNDGTEKHLHEKCVGSFTTKPEVIRMSLAMMVQQTFTFPQMVLVFPDKELDDFLPTSIAKCPVILEGYKGETSIVATEVSYAHDTSTSVSQTILDIHMNVEIDVKPLVLSESEQLQLAEKTASLYQHFNISKAKLCMEKSIARVYNAQSLLNKRIARNQPDGIQLKWPILLGNAPQVAHSGEAETDTATRHQQSPVPDLTNPSSLSSQESDQTVGFLWPKETSECAYQDLNTYQVNREENVYATPITLSVPTPQAHVAMGADTIPKEDERYYNAHRASYIPQATSLGALRHVVIKGVEGLHLDLQGFKDRHLELLDALNRRMEKIELAEKKISCAIANLSTVCCQMQEQLQWIESQLASEPCGFGPPGAPRGPHPSIHPHKL